MDKFLIKKPRLEHEAPQPSLHSPSASSLASPLSHAPSTSTSVDAHPPIEHADKKPSGKGRSFQKSWMVKFSWLEWDASVEKAFCKTCKEAEIQGLLVMNRKKEDIFTTVGFSNWKKGLEKFRVHENTQTHKEGVIKLASLSKPSVAVQLNDQMDSQMKTARSALMDIFTSLKFLCRQGVPIRGHDEVNSNFRQLLELRKHDKPELNDWMGRSGYKWLSHDIQNEIIQILADNVLRYIVNEIKSREYFSIMVDETCDTSVHEQVSFCVRTVDENFEVSEEFIGLYETVNTKSETLFKIVKDVLIRLDISSAKLRGQCYDGASNMSGEFRGLQKLVADLQPQATFVHCTAHSLNLAVQDALRHLPMMRDTMNLAKDLINTVRESLKRVNLYKTFNAEDNNANAKTNLRPLCPTRWTMRVSSMQQILKNYVHLLDFFEVYSSSETSDAASKCAGYRETMLHFKAYFLFSVYCHVMNPVEEANSSVQSPHLGASEVESKLKCLLEILEESRKCFEQFWQNCLHDKPLQVEDPILLRQRQVPKRFENPRSADFHRFGTPKEQYRQIYTEIIDTVKNCVNDRFQSTGLQKVLSVEKECMSVINGGEVQLQKTRAFFDKDIDGDRLALHLSMLRDISIQRKEKVNTMHDLKKFLLKDDAVRQLLPEVSKCVKLLRTVPVTTASAERSFSTLRRLKTYLRSTMTQKRLNNIAVLNTSNCSR